LYETEGKGNLSAQMSEKRKYLFKDELCDAVWTEKKELKCQRGTLVFSGDNVMDFNLYGAWCEGCDKIKVLDRKAFEKQFKNFLKAVDRELEKS